MKPPLPSTRRRAGPSSSVVTLAGMRSRQREDVIDASTPRDGASALQRTPPLPQPHQEAPRGDWRTWLLLGGRGAGKTWAGAFWLLGEVRRRSRLALVGPTLHDVREVMIDGPSGLRALAAPELEVRYEVTRRRVLFANGAEAHAFSAEDPDSLRGPQFHAAWADEFCAWRKGADTLALLRMGLRLGPAPQLMVTTTPKPSRALRSLIAEPRLVRSDGGTAANPHLAPAFLDGLQALYGGTRLAAQELDGRVVEDEAGALWRVEDLQRCRGAPPSRFDRVVVAVDPPATAGGDACGIVAVGRWGGRAFLLADRTVRGLSPLGWAARAAQTAAEVGAAEIVAEVNQGGDMVRTVLAHAGCPSPVRSVRASRSKRDRAVPVAALYEQGRVVHCGDFPELEEELMALGAAEGGASPDRADALVWAVTELLLHGREGPRLRRL